MATAEDLLPAGDGGPDARGVRIREATPEDVHAIAAIEAGAFSNPWHPDTFRSLISEGRAFIIVAQDPGAGVVGYAVFWWVLDQGELANLAVAENFRGTGVGAALLDRILAHAETRKVESLFLEVRMSNARAFDLYRSRGFGQVAIRKDYYRRPREDARVLLKRLGTLESGG